jgi:hypothetical protein
LSTTTTVLCAATTCSFRAGSRLVSVLLPVRDGEAYLDEALRSVAEQTHEELEVVVDDDGSRDGATASPPPEQAR